MSLICVKCGKIIVMSNNPDHYGICASCLPKPTKHEKQKMEQHKLSTKNRLCRVCKKPILYGQAYYGAGTYYAHDTCEMNKNK